MKKLILTALCALPLMAVGQVLLYNDGAMLKVQPGATLFVEGGIQNTASGTIDNDGTIELQGNFINAGMWDPNQANTLRFSGNANSDVTSGSAVFQTVVIQKGTGANVNLLSPMTVNTNLDFNGTNSKLSLGNFHLKLGGSTTVTGYDDDEYVVTGGTGRMKKFYSGNVAFEFPVGFNTTTYNRAEVTKTAGPNDTISVRVLASPTDGNGLTGTPFTSDVVDAVWDISESVVGGNTANVKLAWAESDELTGFDDLLNTVSRNDGTGWDGLFADLGPEDMNTRTKNGYTAFGAFAVGDKPLANELALNTKVFLQGPYNTTTDLMSDALRTGGHLDLILSEPYSSVPYNYAHVGYGGGETVSSAAVFNQPLDADDIVDWIIVEVRDASTPATKLATRAALIQRDGDIVGLDGSSALKVSGLADGTYHIGLKHRNHLPIRTQTAQVMSGTAVVLNFTVDDVAFDNGSPANEPTATVEAGVEAMWGGDADLNNQIGYGTGDRLAVLNKVGSTTPAVLVPGYNREDVDMNGVVGYGTGDRLFILNVVGSTTPARLVNPHQ